MNELPNRELDADLHARIVALTEEAREFEEIEDWGRAIARPEEAFTLVPDPKWDWEAATWLFAVTGDIAFQQGRYEQAREAFRQAMLCTGAIGNPFLYLRRGHTFFEPGDMRGAEEELAGACTPWVLCVTHPPNVRRPI